MVNGYHVHQLSLECKPANIYTKLKVQLRLIEITLVLQLFSKKIITIYAVVVETFC